MTDKLFKLFQYKNDFNIFISLSVITPEGTIGWPRFDRLSIRPSVSPLTYESCDNTKTMNLGMSKVSNVYMYIMYVIILSPSVPCPRVKDTRKGQMIEPVFRARSTSPTFVKFFHETWLEC